MDESNDIFGDVMAEPTLPASTRIDEVLKSKEEDSEKDLEKALAATSQRVIEMAVNVETDEKELAPDYETMAKRLKQGEKLYAVRNVSDIVFKRDWDLSLFPQDLHKEFMTFLSSKYAELGIPNQGRGVTTVVVLIEGRVINFIEQFCAIKNLPTMVITQIGRDVQRKSRIVIRPNEGLIVTADQLKGFEQYEKIKRRVAHEDGKEGMSDWLGFLIFEELTTPEDLKKYRRSIISYKDIANSAVNVLPSAPAKSGRVANPDVIRADA